MEIEENTAEGYLSGQLLVAMPSMSDPRFARSVVYMCVHNKDGAMGLVVNKLLDSISFPDMLTQLGIESETLKEPIHVHFGGPVESGRGFVLHTTDYSQDGTLCITEGVGLTATIDILRDIAGGGGPRRKLFALGYAGWAPGQLDAEIQANGWLHVDADEKLLFDEGLDDKWERAIAKLGIDLSKLSGDAGHA